MDCTKWILDSLRDGLVLGLAEILFGDVSDGSMTMGRNWGIRILMKIYNKVCIEILNIAVIGHQ